MVSKMARVNKSEYVRQLIEKDMKRNKRYEERS